MKKVLSVALATIVTATAAISAYAASSGKITGMTENLSMGYSSAPGSSSVDLGTVYPQDERVEHIYLYDSMFSWDDGYVAATPTVLNNGQIRDARLTAKATNSRVVRDVTMNAREGRIEVAFPKELIGVKELDFDVEVVLSIDGRRQSDHSMIFTGTLANPIIEVYSGYETVDISDGSVAHAQEFVSKVELLMGDGVSYTTRMSKDKRIYATASRTPDRSDDELMEKHRDIEGVINIQASGLNTGGYLKVDGSYGKYHVYDADLNYLGVSTEELPFHSKYYIAAKKLELETEVEEVPEESKATSDPQVSEPQGGSSVVESAASNNANHNPMTGG